MMIKKYCDKQTLYLMEFANGEEKWNDTKSS